MEIIMVKDITSENFEQEVLNSDKPVLVDFWASWCGPCKMIGPAVESVSEQIADKAVFCKLNVDEEPDVAEEYEVLSIPTLMVFKDGQVVAKSIGVKSETEISDMVEESLS